MIRLLFVGVSGFLLGAWLLGILLFMPTVVFAGIGDMFSGKPSVESNDGQFLLIQYSGENEALKGKILVVKGNDLHAVLDDKSRIIGLVFNIGSNVITTEISFKNEKLYQDWFESRFTGYKCLTDLGIQECKK